MSNKPKKKDAPLLQLPGHSACGCTAANAFFSKHDQITFLKSEQTRADAARDADLHPDVDVNGDKRSVLLGERMEMAKLIH